MSDPRDPALSERDQIMQELENRIANGLLPIEVDSAQATKAFVTVSRKFRSWANVPAQERPACFLSKPLESHERAVAGLPNKRTLDCFAYIYVSVDVNDGTAVPDETLNPQVSAVELAVAPDDPIGNRCTLGGLVYDCRIETELKSDAGDLDGDGVSRVPIRIIIP